MILLDISTSYQFRHWKPMGILRVEREVIMGFTQHLGDDVAMGVYDPGSRAYYRIPEEIFEEIIFRNGMQPQPPERALTARSRWRSWVRVARFLRNARARSRAVPGVGEKTHRAREEVIAEELLRLSLEEYGMMTGALKKVSFLMPHLRGRIQQFDDINHRAHFGSLRTVHDQICAEENRIDMATIRHYVSVGGFWSDDRYRFANEMRRDHGWTMHYLIYDLVPILWGHVAEPTTRKTFPLALHWVLWGVDQVWTISETTKRDLLRHIDENGYPAMDPDWVKPIYLGSEVQQSDLTGEEEQALFARYDLEPGQFVMMVGTQEPRKNHDFAYRLWRELNIRHPGKVMPLVWVGQPGWAIEPLMEMVRNDNGLPHQAIRVLSDISDNELVALYRSCRYTIYPSHYEGWGLPVVESLGYGKPCLTSDAPSLIEAGAGASEVIGLFEGEKWLARCFALMHDETAYRAALEHAARFEGHGWDEFRETLCADFLHFLARSPECTATGVPMEASA